ncbi:MAG: hypothetical protein JSV63_03060 [Candidatus Aenigmatarchaeota archaeon]|nr:MAG: hypothetical protein JSV63_03060 [Candidatus Aenigmarchaeota archaeon]
MVMLFGDIVHSSRNGIYTTRRGFLEAVLATGTGILFSPILGEEKTLSSNSVVSNNPPQAAQGICLGGEDKSYDNGHIWEPAVITRRCKVGGENFEYCEPVLDLAGFGLTDRAARKARSVTGFDWGWMRQGHGAGAVSTKYLTSELRAKYPDGVIVQEPCRQVGEESYIALEDMSGYPVPIDGTIIRLGENNIPHRVLWKA